MSCNSDLWEDGPDCHRTVYRRARKEHRCCGCRETIRRGHRYRMDSGVWDGRGASYKYCLRCDSLIDAIVSRGEGFIHEFDCGHSWEDVFGRAPPVEVARLAFATADEMQDEVRDG